MMTQFAFADHSLTLHRYPLQQVSNLQAWDAADEYLLQYLSDYQDSAPLAFINDSFGALLCATRLRLPAHPCYWVSDAATSHLGAKYNLSVNHLNEQLIDWHQQPQQLPATIGLTLMKLPKNLHYFAWQLSNLAGQLPAGSKLLIGAKAKAINAALLQLIDQHFGPASASLAWKKTRVITAIADGKPRAIPCPQQWDVAEYGLKVSNLANVFAANKLDIGARLMLQHLPQGHFQGVVDLGCGNGVLGLRAGQLYPQAQLYFVDDSAQAVESSQQNWLTNGFSPAQAHFHWDDCLSHLPNDNDIDLILCNPPFHQGEAITDHIAWQMFVDAKKRLQNGGILQIVGNRHLGYHIKLKRLFGHCHTVASNEKFVILRASKTA